MPATRLKTKFGNAALLAFVLFTVTPLALFSQSDERDRDLRTRLLLGFKAGANCSEVYAAKGTGFVTDPKLGLAAGAFLAIPLGRYLGLQPEVLFSQKGFKATGRLFDRSYSLERTTSYLDVPVFFAVKALPFLTFLAGPQYSYLLQQKNAFVNGTTDVDQQNEFDRDGLRVNNVGAVVGLDVNIWHVVVGMRSGWDLNDNKAGRSSATPRYNNRWYQLTLGYRIYQP